MQHWGHAYTQKNIHCLSKIQIWEFLSGPVVKTCAFTDMDWGSIPGWRTKIPQAVCPKKIIIIKNK